LRQAQAEKKEFKTKKLRIIGAFWGMTGVFACSKSVEVAFCAFYEGGIEC